MDLGGDWENLDAGRLDGDDGCGKCGDGWCRGCEPEMVKAEAQAEITEAGDELRTGRELAGVDLDEYRRLLRRAGLALVAADISGEPGFRVVLA